MRPPLAEQLNFATAHPADEATLTNHFGGLEFGFSGAGHTIFYDQSTAGSATLINISGIYGSPHPGATEFRGASTAANAKIFNRGSPTGHSHGLTSFFDNATAGSATITLNFGPGGGGRTDFNGNSNAGTATVMIEGRGAAPSGWGGRLTFNDSSSAASANFTIGREVRHSPAIWFDDQSTAANATFVMQDDSHASMNFYGHSSAGNACFDIGGNSTLWIVDDATAANASITVRSNGTAWVRGYSTPGGNPTVTLGSAQIQVLGANDLSFGRYGGTLKLDGFVSRANEATIVVEGGAVANGFGGSVSVNAGKLDHATLVVNGSVAGVWGNSQLLRGRRRGPCTRGFKRQRQHQRL